MKKYHSNFMKERDEMIEIVRKECDGIIQEANCVISNKGNGNFNHLITNTSNTKTSAHRMQHQPEYLSDDEDDIRATIYKLDSALTDKQGIKKKKEKGCK